MKKVLIKQSVYKRSQKPTNPWDIRLFTLKKQKLTFINMTIKVILPYSTIGQNGKVITSKSSSI